MMIYSKFQSRDAAAMVACGTVGNWYKFTESSWILRSWGTGQPPMNFQSIYGFNLYWTPFGTIKSDHSSRREINGTFGSCKTCLPQKTRDYEKSFQMIRLQVAAEARSTEYACKQEIKTDSRRTMKFYKSKQISLVIEDSHCFFLRFVHSTIFFSSLFISPFVFSDAHSLVHNDQRWRET